MSPPFSAPSLTPKTTTTTKTTTTRGTATPKRTGRGMAPHDLDPTTSQMSAAIMEEAEESQQTQTQMEFTQMEFTQQSQEEQLAFDGTSNMSPLSPPPALPWGRLVPCMPGHYNGPVDLDSTKSEYWLGRSSTKCDVAVQVGASLTKKESTMMDWAHSMISNRHCRIVNDGNQILIEDTSVNGTWVNQSTRLHKGDQRQLHSGDELCLVSRDTLRKYIHSGRVLQAVVQHYSYIFVQSSKPRKSPCVNPRTMNYRASQQAAAASPRSSRRIEVHYDIREVLGDGTSGQVRRAIHRQSGQEYAVKVISLRGHLDTTSMEQEVSLLQSLDHPYIVQLVDVFLHHGVAMYLVMELVAGGDLFDRIVDQHRYTEVDARRAMRRLLSAVYYLHEIKNIVHRDLKPENILCSSPTHVKLADFGLAKIMKADGLKTFCGTPQYFAPEVLERRHTVSGEGRYGKPADMWSLGVILYILLTGKPPFSADLDQPQPYACEFDDDALWQNMPMAQELVQQLLRMDPKRRLSVRQACDHPWINTADGDTHSHPLDDPVVTARKRLFSEPEIAVNDEAVNNEEDADDAATSQDETNSIVSKESVLSKEVFAAAATSHQRDNSFFHVEETSDSLFQKAVQPEEENEAMDTKEEDAVETHMSIDNVQEKDTKQPDSEKEQGILSTGETTEPITTNPETATDPTSASPEVAITAELSVTPSECDDCSPPRSPLSSMNLNERSNQFRDHVLGGQNNSQDKSPSPEARRPENNQVAVTPTDSNVAGIAKSTSESQEADVLEDPILSQFSSAPCSLESFPESPQKAASPSNDKKRPMLEEEAGELQQPEAKRGRTVRQTTLSAWFVKKKADD